GNAPSAVANRVVLQARNEGHDLAREGNEIIREASKWVLNWLLLVKYGRKLNLNTLQWIPCKQFSHI
ncbi:unnamed protein product, partial [Linum tenue]